MRQLLMTSLALGLASAATAAPIVRSGAVYFDYVAAPGISWADAETGAAALTYRGASGYLATIASTAENSAALDSFLLSPSSVGVATFDGAWLGGKDITPSTDHTVPGGDSYWEVGPLAGVQFSSGAVALPGEYADWSGIEPNNGPSAAYMNVGASYAGIGQGQWADAVNGLSTIPNDPVEGYIVEFSPSAVPEPATWALSILGFGLVGMTMRRRQTSAQPLRT